MYVCVYFSASDKFNYVPGKTYEFQYDTEVRTSVQGSSEDHAGVHMSATVHMEILSKCELVMRVSKKKKGIGCVYMIVRGINFVFLFIFVTT